MEDSKKKLKEENEHLKQVILSQGRSIKGLESITASHVETINLLKGQLKNANIALENNKTLMHNIITDQNSMKDSYNSELTKLTSKISELEQTKAA